MNNRRNRMKKTRWRKWWSVGDISSVCNVDLLSSRRLKLHRQCLVNPKDYINSRASFPSPPDVSTVKKKIELRLLYVVGSFVLFILRFVPAFALQTLWYSRRVADIPAVQDTGSSTIGAGSRRCSKQETINSQQNHSKSQLQGFS
jgi:hypothetical protein